MPKPRTPNSNQHNADQAHYGAVPVEMFPDGTALEYQIPFWDGVQWHMATILGNAGINVSYDVINNVLEFSNVDYMVADDFTADATIGPGGAFIAYGVLKDTEAFTFTSDAVLMPSFTADAVFFQIQSAFFTADAFLKDASFTADSTLV